MFEIIIVILVALTYAKASKHKAQSNYFWAFVGVIYYFIGEAIFTGAIYLWLKIFPGAMEYHAAIIAIAMIFGTFSGLFLTYFLGGLHGLNIRRVLKGGR